MSTRRELEDVRLGDLAIDPAIQRKANWSRIGHLANNFDMDAFGTITVSARDVGGSEELFVVDGQHRVLAARRVDLDPDVTVPATVFYGLTMAEEAQLFLLLNDTRVVPSFDKFRARVVEGEPAATFLFQTLTEHGYRLRFGSSAEGTFSATAALDWVYDGAGGLGEPGQTTAIQRTLTTIKLAYGMSKKAVQGDIIKGVGSLYVRHGGDISPERLARLMSEKGTPDQLIGRGRSVYVTGSKNIRANGIAIVLTDYYNKYLKDENKLPPWRVSSGR